MEKIIGINPVMEVLDNKEKNIEKIEIFQGLREDKINIIKRKASERNSVHINETVVKTSTGAIEYVDIVKVTNITDTLNSLKKLGYWIYGAEGDGAKVYYEEKYPEKTVVVLGSEGFGIRKKVKENCDILIKIPMHGKINSLNVSVAGGILLSEVAKSIY